MSDAEGAAPHKDRLEQLRAFVIEQRREAVQGWVEHRGFGSNVLGFQKELEAIEAAIKHEENLEPSAIGADYELTVLG